MCRKGILSNASYVIKIHVNDSLSIIFPLVGRMFLSERTASPDATQPLTQSLTTPTRNQDTILETVDGSGTQGEVGGSVCGETGRGGRVERRRRRRTSSVMRTVMWVVTEDNR